MLHAGPGEGADDATINLCGQQPSDEDETPGNPDEEAKDASASTPIEAAEPHGNEGGRGSA